MRKFLVKNFVLYSHMNWFGKHVTFPRSSRILFPLTIFVGLIIVSDPDYPKLQWWDVILLIVLFVAFDFGFSFFKFSYFNRYPVMKLEMDDEQLFDYYNAVLSGELTNGNDKLYYSELKDWKRLKRLLKTKYSGKFTGLNKTLPQIIAVIFVILWYILI